MVKRGKMKTFDEIDKLHNKLKSLRPLSTESIRRLSEDFMIDYTYNSNAIEGSTLTLEETALVVKEGITIAEKPLKHHLEAIGHRDAYYFIEELVKSAQPFDEKALKLTHALVLMDRQSDRGIYRRVPVRIGAFHPCQPFEVPAQMELLFERYREKMQAMHVVERAALFHLEFETIHPFIDGNGRVGRLALNFELMKAGFPPINIKFADVAKYYNCFTHYRENDLDHTNMTELVATYSIEELKRYIKITEEAERINDGL